MSDPLFDAICAISAKRSNRTLESELERIRAFCQSPIEEKLGACLLVTDPAVMCFSAVINDADINDGMHGFYVWPQMPVRTYRADFGVMFLTHVGRFKLVVECDGHDFHEKTKEQAAHDKARDRAFLDEGWPVMRFTGSEIHRDAMKCADEVGDFVIKQARKAIADKRQELMS